MSCQWELLVIDNASETKIEQLVESFTDRLPVRYIPEPTVGTSHARNRAVREANGPVILFTDDDVTFDRQWLTLMTRAIEEHKDCDFWGGSVNPIWSCDVPGWFDSDRFPMLGDCVVRYQQGKQQRYWDPTTDPPFYTANLALRVERVAQVGYFDISVGHRAGVRVGMEDSLMVQAIHGSGGKGWYVADAVVHHPVPPSRLTKKYARQFAWRQGWMGVESIVRRQAREGHIKGTGDSHKVPRWLYRVAIEQIFMGCGRWARGLIRRDPAERFAGQFAALFNCSKLWHAAFKKC